MKQLNKELKREKRRFENEYLKEKVKNEQFQEIIKMLGISHMNKGQNIEGCVAELQDLSLDET